MTISSWRRRMYDLSIKHWVVSAVILTLSSSWFVFLKFFGKDMGLVDDNGNLVDIWRYITGFLVFISLLFALARTAADKYNEKAKNDGQFVLNRMFWSVDAVMDKKLRDYGKYIDENHDNTTLSHLYEVIKPESQIESLLENIQITLSEIFGIRRSDIGLSIIYRPDTCNDWHRLCTVNVVDNIDLQDLVTNPSATVRQIIDGKESSLFYPDKREAIKIRRYVAGRKDRSFGMIGSIFCCDLSIETSHKYLYAVLSITTYGKQLCEEKDTRTKHKIANLIVPVFERRLRTELALLYIKEHMYASD